MTTTNTALRFGFNDSSKLKLHVIELLEKTNWETVKLAFPGVSRASAFRWKKRYIESGKRLSSLLPISTIPKRVGEMVVPYQILGFIKEIRKKYPKTFNF